MDTRLPGRRLWEATVRAATETPPDRDRVVDLLRIGSLLVVVVGHVLMGVARWRGESVRISNLLAEVPELEILTWALQVMPAFFAAGAIANRRSLASATARGVPWRGWLWQRLLRLVRPTAWYLVAWIPIVWVLSVLLPESAPALTRLSTQLLWFLGVYVLVIVTTPWQIRLAALGYPAVAALLATIGVVDVLRFHVAPAFGLVNFLLVWFMAATLGLVVRDRVGRARRVFVAWAIGALALNAALVALLPYPLSMVGLPGERVSNMAPPTVVLALHAVVLLSLVGLAWPTLDRLCASVGVWRAVAVLGAATMTIYLWHLTALVVVTAAEHVIGVRRGAVDELRFWLVTVVHTTVILLLVLVIVGLAVPLEHRRLPWIERAVARPAGSAWWTALEVCGITCVGCGFLVLAATGMAGFPFSRVTHYLGLPLTPGMGFLLLGGGVLLARAAGSRVESGGLGPVGSRRGGST